MTESDVREYLELLNEKHASITDRLSALKSIPFDLHHHTRCSDGYRTPRAVVFDARRKGLKAVGIVDHNTSEHFEESFKAGRILNIDVLLGIEFDFFTDQVKDENEECIPIDGKHVVVSFLVREEQ